MAQTARGRKIQRLERGKPPRVLDLFAGCGGISLGFHAAGFEIAAAVEVNTVAARTHAINFAGSVPERNLALRAEPRDITRANPRQLVAELKLGRRVDSAVDVIVGGPPCQAFARVGRAKLRAVSDNPHAYRNDPRAKLYRSFLEYVEEFQPLAVLAENVPDILNYGGANIAELMCQALSKMGYVCAYTLLNSVYYGVPQMRERMFLLAFARELGTRPVFPTPSHWIALPRGYEGTRRFALKYLTGSLFDPVQEAFYSPPPQPSPDLPPAITAEEAIGDLPPITYHLNGQSKRGARRFEEALPYPVMEGLNPYSQLMRSWPGFENQDGVRDHVIRHLPRDYAIFRRMNAGDQYPQAYEHAMKLLQEKLEDIRAGGQSVSRGSTAYKRLERETVPPYDSSKFPNKWRKMEPDLPARTLMAHLGKDSYSHIHFDSDQARTISVREAARLQSFPDGFVFSGTMNPAFWQIGNAVPPLMANALAHSMLKAWGLTTGRRLLVQELLDPDKRRPHGE